MLGVLITVGMLAGYMAVITSADISHGAGPLEAEWMLRSLRLFLPSFSFGVAGFTALFYWDALFPDRRDFLILAPFPIPLAPTGGRQVHGAVAVHTPAGGRRER